MAEKYSIRWFGMAEAAHSFGAHMIHADECHKWLLSQLFPEGRRCSQCGAPIPTEVLLERLQPDRPVRPVRCSCGHRFMATTHTILSGTKLEPREVYLLAVLSDLGVTAARIAAVLGCHSDTVLNWQAHFKAHAELASA